MLLFHDTLLTLTILIFSLQEVKDHRVNECKFFHTLEGSAGFAIMTNKYQFFVLGDSDRFKDELRFKKMADLPPSKCRGALRVTYFFVYQF